MSLSAFDQLYTEVKNAFGEGKLTKERIIVLTPRIIRAVQEVGAVSQLSGMEKKELFFEVINKFIDDANNLSDEEKDGIKIFVQISLPLIVDAVVFAYKSEAFKKIKQRTKKCIGKCLS